MKADENISDPNIAKALAHPLRARILGVLDEGVASPRKLSDALGAPLGNVSYHVRILASLGLIELVRTTPARGAVEHHYKACKRAVITDEAWGQLPDLVKRAMIGANLAQTGLYVQAAANAGGFGASDAHLSRTTFTVDDEAWRELSAELAEHFKRVREIAQRTEKRLKAEPHGATRPASVVLMLFEGGEPAKTPGKPPKAKSTPRRRRETDALLDRA